MSDLIESAKRNDLQKLKVLIARGDDVNVVDHEYGRSALWWAARWGRVESATALIDVNADVNKADYDGFTPLHQASLWGSEETIHLLLQHKANVNALSTNGSSPLHDASCNGLLVYVQLLIAAGAERDRPNKDGYTPLALAIMGNHPNVALFLLHSGAKMKNVQPNVKIRAWMTDIIQKCCSVMNFTLALKGALKWRCGIYKDIAHLIALYFWSRRLK